MRLTILGAPRTKKTSQRILRRRGGAPFVTSSINAGAWEADAIGQLRRQILGVALSSYTTKRRGKTVTLHAAFVGPVAVRAVFFRDADRGDLTGYLQAVGDALERAGVVANDKLIHSWDGSRKDIDRRCPRVEIELEPLA